MPIGTDSFEPTKVSRATVFPSFSVALRLTWGTINLKSVGEGRLRYLAQAGADTEYYNIAKDLATVNSRNEEITDRKGNLYGYWCKVETVSAANDILALSYIPNSWKVRNAFRKFHFAREEMFRDAGITKREMGKYGRTLRPYFSKDHLATTSQVPQRWSVTALESQDYDGGEWTYSSLVSSPTFIDDGEDMGDTDLPPVDEWQLTVLGSHDVEATSSDGVKTWTSVAMVQAYNQDRMEEIPDATAGSSITSLNNPLASLKTQTMTSGEIAEVAEDQQLEAPPYSIADTGDSTSAVYDSMPVAGTAGATAQLRNWGLYFFPAGLISLSHGVAASSGLEIQVIGKELCKDVA